MTEMKMSVEDFLDQYGVGAELTHHGVKGQKWGVRKARTTGSTGHKARPLGSSVLKSEAAAKAGKVAFTVAKAGVPSLLIATGVGTPIAVSLGVSMKLISDPVVKDAMSSAGKYAKSVMSDIGDIKMSDIVSTKTTTSIEPHNKNNLRMPDPKHPQSLIFNPARPNLKS